MGQDISRSAFSAEEHAEFHARLRAETATLNRWLNEGAFEHSSIATTGLELEAWLIDQHHLPSPHNAEFIAAVNDRQVVPELSKYNFEINIDPEPLQADFLSRTHAKLESAMATLRNCARSMGLGIVATGILPTVRDEMLQLEWMSESPRYRALNNELFRLRAGSPLHIHIEGRETLDYHSPHLMLEAACTSLQGHLKVNPEQAVRLYNASVIAAAPLVAATANSPFLYGKSLWSETRIAAFEQSTALHGFRDAQGRDVPRVTLGTGYLRHSMLELFLENLSYPVLLPALSSDGAHLAHLRLQNGTIWRWLRPIIGVNDGGAPHLRIEQRVMPAGPSIEDCIANLALSYGLALALGEAETPPELEIPFEDARANFYACARHGMESQVLWRGKSVDVQDLLLERLLPDARRALENKGVSRNDLDHYFDDVLGPRIQSGQTGANWQRRFTEIHGTAFQALAERYADLQATGMSVHQWTL